MSPHRLTPTLAIFCVPLSACGASTRPRNSAANRTVVPGIAGCHVTTPNGRTPPAEPPSPVDHGSGALWTVLPLDGRIVARPPFTRSDGSMRIKFPWWGSPRAAGELRITGTSLDPQGRVAQSRISRGLTGAPHFWASAIVFPTSGCWRITGTAGRASLTFVVSVTKGG